MQDIDSIGGEGGIRTHVPELTDHLISSQRRYDHFGTSPQFLDGGKPARPATFCGGWYSSEARYRKGRNANDA